MYELYNNLVAMKKQGIIIDKVEFDRFPLLDGGIAPSIKSAFYDFSKYDIIHNLAIRPLSLLRKGNAVTLATVHDFRMLTTPDVNDEYQMNLKVRLGDYFILKGGAKFALGCDYLCVSSTQTENEAISLGYKKDRIFLVNLGVDKRFIGKQPKKRIGKIFKIGHIGALGTTKNIRFAVDAFNKLSSRNDIFEIWGNSLSSEYYKSLVDASKSNRKIIFRGFAPEKDLVKIYDSFDVFVYPSKYEGFGLHIFEAQARGLPVIIYKDAMIPKEVRKYCMEARDEAEMAEMVEDIKENGYGEQKRREAMEYARSFTWEKTAIRMIEVYNTVLAKN